MKNKLVTTTEITVRFSEVDSMGVVWHGNYIKYFEDGREDFGNKYQINYLEFKKRGIIIPIVKMVCEYKRPLVYGDTAIVETRFVNTEAAKIHYEYTIYKGGTREVVATGSSLQVFTSMQGELMLDFPEFFVAWKRKNGLLV